MAILKTVYGSTGSTSYEAADGVLHLDARVIRIYSKDGIQEREMEPGDRVELLDKPECILAEDCPDVDVGDDGIAAMNKKLGGVKVDLHLQNLYHELFKLQHEAQNNKAQSWAECCSVSEKIKIKTKEIADYLGDC